jgi:hypothetical protein
MELAEIEMEAEEAKKESLRISAEIPIRVHGKVNSAWSNKVSIEHVVGNPPNGSRQPARYLTRSGPVWV